jgi:asparagine synthase (glutamine-hydrolysing)
LSPQSFSRQGFFSVKPIREKGGEHVSGARNWQYLLWPVLMFQAWTAQNASAAGGSFKDSGTILSQRVTH